MRPVKITMRGFCSYGERTEIDFTKPQQNLFLITGDTGSGKTTIFDAIVFALFGKASALNDGKSGTEFQSDFSDYTVEPFVELIFSEKKGEKNQLYRVKRIPRHNSYKKGSKEIKKTPENEMVYLSLMNDDEEDAINGNLAVINDKIKEIIGLTREQFMQLSMIAQGEFMEVLKGKDKQEIFRKLFNTDIYKGLTDKIRELNKEKQNEVDLLEGRFNTLLNKLKSQEMYDEEVKNELKEILGGNILIDTEIIDNLAFILDKEYSSLKEKCQDTEEKEKKILSERDKQNEILSKAEGLEQQFDKYDFIVSKKNEYKRLEPIFDEKRNILDKMEKFYAVKNLFDRCSEIRLNVEKKSYVLEKNKKLLPDLEEKQEKCCRRERKAKEKLDFEISQFSEISQRVSAELENIEKLEIIQKEELRLKSEKKKLDENLEKIEEGLQKLTENKEKWTKELEDLRKLEPELIKIENDNNLAKNIMNEVNSLSGTEYELTLLSEDIKKSETIWEEKNKKYSEKSEEYAKIQTLFWSNQAGIVASKLLKKGEPCPVCGSKNHPKPCEIHSSTENVTKEILYNIESEVKNLKEELDEESGELGGKKAKFLEKNNNFISNKKKLEKSLSLKPFNFNKDLPISIIRIKLESVERLFNHRILEIKEGLKRNEDIERQLENSKMEQSRLNNDREIARKKKAEIDEKIAGTVSLIKSLENSRKFKSREEAIEEREVAEELRNSAEEVLEMMKRRYERSIREKEKVETTVKNLNDELPELQAELSKKEEAYKNSLENLGIAEDIWQLFVKKYDISEKPELEKFVKEFDEEKAIINSEFKNIKRELKDKERPDISKLKNEFNLISSEYNKTKEECTRLSGSVVAIKNLLDESLELRKDAKKVFKEFNTVNSLFNKLTGKVKGRKVDIETFAQRYYLEHILTEANRRFNKMTSGQYTLELYDLDEAGEGKNRGLDLRVHCNMTGKDRDVRTLSGGESFMAALSLALGMADKVQERVGAINLDIMFVDEGFGSLDDNSRNEAIKLLKNLAGGSKLIGIISHVSELKNEIDEKLIVTKTENGSRVAWKID